MTPFTLVRVDSIRRPTGSGRTRSRLLILGNLHAIREFNEVYASHFNEAHHKVRDEPAGLWRSSILAVSRRPSAPAGRKWPGRDQSGSPNTDRRDHTSFTRAKLGVGPWASCLERRTLCMGKRSLHSETASRCELGARSLRQTRSGLGLGGRSLGLNLSVAGQFSRPRSPYLLLA